MGLDKTDREFKRQSKGLRIYKMFMKNNIIGETCLQDMKAYYNVVVIQRICY